MERIDDGGHDNQCHEKGHHGRAHTQRRTRMACQSVPSYDGVGYQCVRGHDGCKQKGAQRRIVQQSGCHGVSHSERYEKGQQPEDGHAVAVLFQPLHVHFQTGKEHDIIEADTSEKLKRGITLQYVQSVLPHDDTRQHHADDMRNAQPSHDDG